MDLSCAPFLVKASALYMSYHGNSEAIWRRFSFFNKKKTALENSLVKLSSSSRAIQNHQTLSLNMQMPTSGPLNSQVKQGLLEFLCLYLATFSFNDPYKTKVKPVAIIFRTQ